MGLTYTTWLQTIETMMPANPGDPPLAIILPSALDYAQDRINRELNLLSSNAAATALLSTGSRTLTLPANTNVLQDLNLITPEGVQNPDNGLRNPLTVASKEWLDSVYGSSAGSGVPKYFAMFADQVVLVGPWPDQAYTVEVIATVRPDGLTSSAPNGTTWISTYLPDLLVAASMVFISGYMKNFGAQADDPRQAVSWETQYTTLATSAKTEDARRKFYSTGYFTENPNPLNPPRT